MSCDVSFAQPTRVVVEASLDVICREDLNTLDGEQFDAIDNVIRIIWHRNEIEFVTVRTLERPIRGVTLPRSAVDRVIY
jgi:hypothetical protein